MAKPKAKKASREADSGCQEVPSITRESGPCIPLSSFPLHMDVNITGVNGQSDSSMVRVWLSPADMVTMGTSADGLVGVSVLERRKPIAPGSPSPSASSGEGQGPSPGAARAASIAAHMPSSKASARQPSPAPAGSNTPPSAALFKTPSKPQAADQLPPPHTVPLQRLWSVPGEGVRMPMGDAGAGSGDGGQSRREDQRLGAWLAVAVAWPAAWLQRGTARVSHSLADALGGATNDRDALGGTSPEAVRVRLFPLHSAPCWTALPAHAALAEPLVTGANGSAAKDPSRPTRLDTGDARLTAAPTGFRTPPRPSGGSSEHTSEGTGDTVQEAPACSDAAEPLASKDGACCGGLTRMPAAAHSSPDQAMSAVTHDCLATVTLRLCALEGQAPTGSPQVVANPPPPALPPAAPLQIQPQRKRPTVPDASPHASLASHGMTLGPSPLPATPSTVLSTPIRTPTSLPGPAREAHAVAGGPLSSVSGTPSGAPTLPPAAAPSPATPAVKAWTPQASRLPGSASSLPSTPGPGTDRGYAGSPAVTARGTPSQDRTAASVFGDALPKFGGRTGEGSGNASTGKAGAGADIASGGPLGPAIVDILAEGGDGDAAPAPAAGASSGSSKGMLELFAAHWLQGRHLVDGGLVRLPLMGRWCIFGIERFELSSSACSSRLAPELATPRPAVTKRLSDEEFTMPDTTGRRASESPIEPLFSSPAHVYKVSSSTKVRLTLDQALVRAVARKGLRTGVGPGASGQGASAASAHNSARSTAMDRVPARAASAASSGLNGPSGDGPAPGVATGVGSVQFAQLGGVGELRRALREAVELPLAQPELMRRYGIVPAKGVLLYGPPGTGKTSLVQALASSARASFFPINGPELVSAFYGESEASLRAVFARAVAAQPAIIFLDEIDAVATRREEDSEEMGQRLVATLLTLMDGYGGEGSLVAGTRVVVLASTNRPEALDPALRRPGRFDLELEVGVPTPAARREILHAHLARVRHSLSHADVAKLASATHGFVGADLAALVGEASLGALRRIASLLTPASSSSPVSPPHLPALTPPPPASSKSFTSEPMMMPPTSKPVAPRDQAAGSSTSSEDACLYGAGPGLAPPVGASWQVTIEDFERAQTVVRPSAMREVMLEVPSVRWSDIGGQEDVKQRLQEIVEWPQRHPEAFQQVGVTPPRGVLLYGPPGCSKTLLARAVASEAGLNFIAIKGPEIFSKWVGESEKAIQKLFARARTSAPTIIFFDEIDGLGTARDDGQSGGHGGGCEVAERVMSQLLSEMDGLASRARVVVVAATNRPDIIDSALLRPGRLDRLLYVAPPDTAARQQILGIHLRRTPLAGDVSVDELARRTEGYTGADIGGMCRDACMAALEEDLTIKQVHQRHFEAAIRRTQPSKQTFNEEFYSKFQRGGRVSTRKP